MAKKNGAKTPPSDPYERAWTELFEAIPKGRFAGLYQQAATVECLCRLAMAARPLLASLRGFCECHDVPGGAELSARAQEIIASYPPVGESK